jgi:hypothetical protein
VLLGHSREEWGWGLQPGPANEKQAETCPPLQLYTVLVGVWGDYGEASPSLYGTHLVHEVTGQVSGFK